MDKTIADFIKNGRLTEVNKKHDKHCPGQAVPNSVGTLMLIPKKHITDMACRPLVINTNKRLKYQIGPIKKKLKMLCALYDLNGTKSLYQKWIDFLNGNQGRKIYGKFQLKLNVALFRLFV